MHEYTAAELAAALSRCFGRVEMLGVFAVGPAARFQAERLRRIQRITRLDPLGLRRRLPRPLVDWLFAHLSLLVRVSIGRDGTFTTIAETPVMTREVDFRRWTPLEADLSAWAGQRVTLRIELVTTQSPGRGHLGYVGSPRIALRPP